MKEKFEDVEFQVIELEGVDIITGSNDGEPDDNF